MLAISESSLTDHEQLNYIHRFAGILLVVASNVHSIGYSELNFLSADL